MTNLELWLKEATRCLSKDSAAQVRTEIGEHFESARDAAAAAGARPEEADRAALSALGSATAANRQYRKILLTAAEAKVVRQGACEANLVGRRPVLKWTLRAMPAAALAGAGIAFAVGGAEVGRILLAAAILFAILLTAPTFPIYTPFRARIYRIVKWVVFAAVLVSEPSLREMSWLLPCCFWPLIWNEYMRISIRRKLPMAEWPRQMYL